MATSTLGTNANNSIGLAMAMLHTSADADFAALSAAIKADNTQQTVMSGSFTKAGILFVPRRGYLKVFDGDWVGVDSRGWPILLSADTIASGPWTHS